MQERLLKRRYKSQPETVQRLFLNWLNWLLRDARWRAFIRTKVKEHELPVIEYNAEENANDDCASDKSQLIVEKLVTY